MTTEAKTANSGFLERKFQLAKRGTTGRLEVVGGVATYLTMVYIVFVNPAILGLDGAGLQFGQVLTVTALVGGVMTIVMGLVTNYPFAIASGLGLNAVVAFQLVGAEGLTFPEAMGVVVTEGIIITVLVLTGLREAVMNAIPHNLKLSIAAGIGLFITIIGFANGGLSVPGPGSPLLTRGDIDSARVAVFFAGLLFVAVLVAKRVKGALLIGIVSTTVLAIVVNATSGGDLWTAVGPGVAQTPTDIVAWPDFSLLGQFSFGFIPKMGLIAAALAVFTLMLADFFDTMGTAIGLGKEAG
ncbi:MAG TPA: NCS2 family permease, partial [Halomonas sp.]|nr:NCS2 family permease [Halomonas sp.]